MTAALPTPPSPSAAPYVGAFADVQGELPGAGSPGIAALRAAALDRFARHGIPGMKLEAWKYTNLNPLAKLGFRPSSDTPAAGALPSLDFIGDAYAMVFVGGRLQPHLSRLAGLPGGVVVAALADRLRADDEDPGAWFAAGDNDRALALVALNAAFMQDGAVIKLASGVTLDKPLHLVFVAPPGGAVNVRNLVTLESRAAAQVIETYLGADGAPYWTNAVTAVRLRAGARLGHYKQQAEGDGAYHSALVEARLGQGAAYDGFVFSHGARLARNEVDLTFAADGATCRLDGLALARGRQHCDNTTRILHASGHCASQQMYKAVVDGEARAVFQGRIRVAPDAVKSDARQLSRNLLLSQTAMADVKPELEILNDDVKCSHGAAIGDLDKEAMYYLRSRGLDEARARVMLIEAFAADAIDGIGCQPVREQFSASLRRWLGGAHD
jgi:Fe-S cluster assembly protein SufD